jgi:quinol monooxygenase YgiN
MVVLLARVSVKPEDRDSWLDLVRAVAALSRAEAGCEGYAICEDIETPNDFIFVERWRTLGALRGHFQTPHFGDLFGALPKMVVGPPDVQIHDAPSTVAFDELLAAAGVGR